MKRYFVLWLIILAVCGCVKTSQLEQHEARVVSVVGVTNNNGSITYLYDYLDLHTGVICSDRSDQPPPKEGEVFIKNVWVPVR